VRQGQPHEATPRREKFKALTTVFIPHMGLRRGPCLILWRGWSTSILSLVLLALIFIVLQSRYRSPVLALIIIGSVPLALIGSVAALWIAGQPLSVASMIGFVTLAGISTRNGILKISRYINLAMHEGEQFGRDLVIRGSLERLAPVLLTALCAGLALMPLLLGAGEAGREILHPVAVTHFRRPAELDVARCDPHSHVVSELRSKAVGASFGGPN
jgi:AcrB/AcrD/AcrF family